MKNFAKKNGVVRARRAERGDKERFGGTLCFVALNAILGGVFAVGAPAFAQESSDYSRLFGSLERARASADAAPSPRRAVSRQTIPGEQGTVYPSARSQNAGGASRGFALSGVENADRRPPLRSVSATEPSVGAFAATPNPISNLSAEPLAPAPIATGKLETLDEAMNLAVSASRGQRALALKSGAARSATDAARSLRNPKITNATVYVSAAERPAIRSEVDISGLKSAIPESVAPIFAGLPSTFEATTITCDQNFVATATSAILPVYLGGRVQALTRSAEAAAQAARAGEDVGEQNVRSETAEAYFLVLRTRKLREVATEAVEAAARHSTDAERMFAVGTITKNVVLAARVALAEARQTELRVANAQRLAEAAYNRLLWRSFDSPVNIADVDFASLPPIGDLDAATARAVRNRAELRVLAAETRAVGEQENVARADVLPQVGLVGTVSYWENSRMTENANATGAVGMVWTPFDGGTSRARQNAARQSAAALARARDEAESAIRLQVYQSWLAESEARERVEVARTSVEQAEENYRVVSRGFQEGIVNHTEALDALALRTAAKSNLANAEYDAVLAARRSSRALGDL